MNQQNKTKKKQVNWKRLATILDGVLFLILLTVEIILTKIYIF